MFGTKVAAMKRIAEETDSKGSASFPTFMLENMRGWQREGLIEIVNHGTAAKITDKGRQLANGRPSVERLKAARLANRLSQAKAGMRYGYVFAKVHPSLTPEERDLIVRALNKYAEVTIIGEDDGTGS